MFIMLKKIWIAFAFNIKHLSANILVYSPRLIAPSEYAVSFPECCKHCHES